MHVSAIHPGKAEGIRPPLFVDLDGTLVLSDMMLEQILGLMKRNPLGWPKVFYWFTKGRPHLKEKLQETVAIDPATLPYNRPLLKDLRKEAATGRRLYLATGADKGVATAIADHLDIFSGVLASDGKVNLVGEAKLQAIEQEVKGEPFAYIGDSKKDLPIFRKAAAYSLVNPSNALKAQCLPLGESETIYQSTSMVLGTILKALRPHQWTKNVLVFVPLLTAHAWQDPLNITKAAVAFLAFCAMASATYLINDMLDIQSDRHHPEKRNRPFASGTLPIGTGLMLVPLFFAMGLVLGWLLGLPFFTVVLIYFFTSQLYSVYLKSLPLLDVTALAGLFTLRVFSGAYAIGVPLSHWLLAFSMFLFFSLAFVKRYAELHNLRSRGGQVTLGRGYSVDDIDQLALFGVISGFMSVLVLALYLSSPEVEVLYRKPEILWLLCPVFLLWINWIWMAAKRGNMHEDPILFAFKDPASYIAGCLMISAVFFSL